MTDKEKDKSQSKLKYAKRTGTPGNYVYWHEDEKKAMIPGDRPKNIDEINSKPRYEHHPHDSRATDQVGHKKAAEEAGSDELEPKKQKPKKPSTKESETKLMPLKKDGGESKGEEKKEHKEMRSLSDRVSAIEKEHKKLSKDKKSFMGEGKDGKEKLLKEGQKDAKKCMRKSTDDGEDEYVEIDKDKLEKILNVARKYLNKGCTPKEKRCVKEVKKESPGVNPYAVCRASIGGTTNRKSMKKTDGDVSKLVDKIISPGAKVNEVLRGLDDTTKRAVLTELRARKQSKLKKAGGEGSKGGRIVGRTKSGKPIYESGKESRNQAALGKITSKRKESEDWDKKFAERMKARKEKRNQAAVGKVTAKRKEGEEADKKFGERMKELKEKRNQAFVAKIGKKTEKEQMKSKY